MGMAGGAAGQAKGHNTKSTMEGAGLGTLLGLTDGAGAAMLGSGAGSAGAAGVSAADEAAAATGSDALGSSLTMTATGAGMPSADSLGLNGLLASSQAGAGAGSADIADASMLGAGSSQGVSAADMGAIADGNPTAPGVMGSEAAKLGSFGASQPGMNFVTKPWWQQYVTKGMGKANDVGWTEAIKAAMTPNTTTSVPGQPLLNGAPPSALQNNTMQMPNYTQQMQMLGFA